MKQLLLFLAFLFAGTMHAHQSDVSTTMLVEQQPGTWKLYVNSSLNAFEYEVKKHFGENAFATAEEFQELALQHLKNTLSVKFNGNEQATLTEGSIKLGHETGIVFTLANIPADLKDLQVVNTAFADIHRNKSILVVLKKDREKVQLELNAANEHTAKLDLRGDEIQTVASASVMGVSSGLVPVLLLSALALAGLSFLGLRIRQADLE